MENKPDKCQAPSLLDPHSTEGWLVKREPSPESKFLLIPYVPLLHVFVQFCVVNCFHAWERLSKSRVLHQTILRVSQSSTHRFGNTGRKSQRLLGLRHDYS